jgi:hypothetical protein
MPIAAVAIGAAVVGGLAVAGSGGSTINEQRAQAISLEAERKALERSGEALDFEEEALAPFIEVGNQSIGTLGEDIDELTAPFTEEDFKADPGFQFRIQQGERGINNFLSSRGLATSGRAGKELTRFNQQEATGEFDRAFNRFQTHQGNRFNRLLSLARTGQDSTNQLVGASQTAASRDVRTITKTGEDVAQSQSEIGAIENAARRRRGDAIAGAAKSIGTSFAGGAL